MTLTVHDTLWGEFEISEPVLLELIASAPVQRLKSIHQAGASYYLYPEIRPVTRHEHSLGVMRLLQLVGAPIEEQIAGLLHDVPHTAFSHTADALFPNDEHNFHERFHREIISNSEILPILEQHHISPEAALEPDLFTSLERPLPDLCADRIDYALRDMSFVEDVRSEDALRFAGSLRPTGQGLVSHDVESALWFSHLFRQANDCVYTSVDDAGAYWALSGAIRRAMEIGQFDQGLLFSTDDEAMSALKSSDDAIVKAFLSLLNVGTHFHIVQGAGEPFFTARMKQRRIDPLVQPEGLESPGRLSKLVPQYREELDTASKESAVSYRLWTPAMPSVLVDALQRAPEE